MKETKSFYNTQQWKKAREAYRKKAGGLCENCMQKGIISPGEIVHHIEHVTPDNMYNPEITLSFKNMRLLCRQCHGEIHRQQHERFYIDDRGNVIAR